ncbi:MAG: ATP-dependent DNA helicase [Sphingomonadaceae bacterium]|nr:ATP-dependent DNA helicase [Sphingomonadaceae bacterium]MDW8415598.1 ATP-dependent DNA helicase [Thermaurantiacus sp.]
MASSCGEAWFAAPDGTVEVEGARTAARRLARRPHLIVNAPLVAARLGLAEVSGLDLLELFAFVHPARFVAPAAGPLAEALGLPRPADPAQEALLLPRLADRMLATLADPAWAARAGAAEAARRLGRHGWPWAALVTAALPAGPRVEPDLFTALPEWEETPPRPPPRVVALHPTDVARRLAALAGARREPRPQQRAYAEALLPAFAPRDAQGRPHLVVAEAGTGTGKTLGYLAAATLYAERTDGAVWISTYTRALQRQLRHEASTSLPPRPGGRPVVVRKGRENYLCLLNLEDARRDLLSGRAGQFAELVARWARFTEDGDMVGGDLPGWLPTLFRSRGHVPSLTDRRGECIRAACPHFRRCFIEHSVRAATHASLIIANHALTLHAIVRGAAEVPRRLVFDEGHHLWEAADSAFALDLTGTEAIELRRWLLGPEAAGRRAARRRGLAARLDGLSDLGEASAAAREALASLARVAARVLPADGWRARILAGEPEGPVEALLADVRTTVLARAHDDGQGYSLETSLDDLPPAVIGRAREAAEALAHLRAGMDRLRLELCRVRDGLPEGTQAPLLARLEAAVAGLEDRCALLRGWEAQLARVGGPSDPEFVDWLGVTRAQGEERDAGLFRRWLDPLKPLALGVLARAHGVVVTSATLIDPAAPQEELEHVAGARYLGVAPRSFRAPSPFDYGAAARVFVVTDVDARDPAAAALALLRLIEAAQGGALGLFTAVARLRAVHARLAPLLAERRLPLYAQHVDPLDTGTLVDLFRADPRASILGTDALRDGIDVPGHSLRLVVFEGVPWSRPSILEVARRQAFGGPAYEDRQVRRRLVQAFGRLIRRADDRGVFVLLGPSVPSRLLSAFPPEVPVARLGLEQAAAATAAFLHAAGQPVGALPRGEGATQVGE